ncbi:MAG: mechanosensitive ion channel family protein [Pseudomonadota bacterium]
MTSAMENFTATLSQWLESAVFSYTDTLTIGVSLLLYMAASPICRWLKDDDNLLSRISMMRMLNLLIVLAVLANVFFIKQSALPGQIAQSLIVIYFTVLLTQFINYFIRKRFGKERVTQSKSVISDTYSSRWLSLFVTALMAIIAIVSVLRLMGLDSLLEAGGALGIIGLILAMTQASWAPDIISGLIILNSRFCEEGDVIQFNMDGKTIVASVFKTKIFHTECLDLANNHRIMVRNAKLRDYGLQNLSRFASARGLREVLLFNIDYQHSQNEVTQMIERAFAEIDRTEGAREEQYEPEIRVHDTGDYAVTWAVYYYIKDVRKLLSIRQVFRAYILAEANKSNISLATPDLQSNTVSVSNASLDLAGADK